MPDFLGLLLAGAVIALPTAALETFWLIRQRRRGAEVQPVMFCQMETGKRYRVRIGDIEKEGTFVHFLEDCAIFDDGEFIRRRVIDEVEVTPL